MTDEASIMNHDNRPKTNKIARAMYIRLLLAAGLSDRPSSPIVIHRSAHPKNIVSDCFFIKMVHRGGFEPP